MRTLGVDLASQPANTAICAISWPKAKGARVEWIRKGVDDDSLLAEIDRFDKVGVDAPLGWPQPFVEAVTAHSEGRAWPAGGETADAQTRSMRMRATDLTVGREFGKWPLSVSADTLGVVAFRLARVQRLLAERGDEVDRAGRGRICEVYPGAALVAWGLAGPSYKGAAAAARRRRLLKDVLARVGLEIPRDCSRAAREDDDCLDSLLSALVARATAIGATRSPTGSRELGLARCEGWIHVPTCEPGELTRG